MCAFINQQLFKSKTMKMHSKHFELSQKKHDLDPTFKQEFRTTWKSAFLTFFVTGDFVVIDWKSIFCLDNNSNKLQCFPPISYHIIQWRIWLYWPQISHFLCGLYHHPLPLPKEDDISLKYSTNRIQFENFSNLSEKILFYFW